MVLFLKKNDRRQQFLKKELSSISQCDMTIAQYFQKVKYLCWEIFELDSITVIENARIKRIIIHSVRSKY